MSLSILQTATAALLLISIAFGLLRMLLGPTTPDRLVAADTLGVITTGGLTAIAALFATPIYLDIALVYGSLAFVGTVAIARALEGDKS